MFLFLNLLELLHISLTSRSPSGYFSNISLIENAISPVAPFPRQLALYSKSNDNLYIMNSLGTETLISLSATGMEPNQVFATPDGVFRIHVQQEV